MVKKAKRKLQPSTPKQDTENKALKEISYRINAFGQIVRDVKTDDINAFLDENVPDKKFTET